MTPFIAPPPLQPGDLVAVVAPAGQLQDPTRFERGLTILSDMGFQLRFPRDLWPGSGYLADSDHNRAQELHGAFSDPEVKGVIAARGGYGCLRLLQHLDLTVIRNNPKILVGFSDITILLNHLVAKTGLCCFHGPVVTSLADTSSDGLERFHHCMAGNWRRSIAPKKLEILRGDTPVQGRLIGGNLSSLMTLVGTDYDIDWTGSILLLEDIGEPLYRIDRLLTHLRLTGKIDGLAGILLGEFTFNHNQDFLEKLRYTEWIWKRVLELTQPRGIPVWGNIPSGHGTENLTLPFGAEIILDCLRGELRFC